MNQYRHCSEASEEGVMVSWGDQERVAPKLSCEKRFGRQRFGGKSSVGGNSPYNSDKIRKVWGLTIIRFFREKERQDWTKEVEVRE